MTTAATMIDECLSHLYSATREQINTLSGAYTAAGTSLTFTYDLAGIQPGATVAVDLELFHVVAVSGLTATVIPQYGGSTGANHSSGSIVYVNPKFSRFRVFQMLNNELAALPTQGLFQPKTVDLTYQPQYQGYDLTSVTSVKKILEVRAQRNGSDKGWDTLPVNAWQLQRSSDTAVFTSGFSLQLLRGESGRKVRVVYAAPFGALTAEATDPNAAGVGFPAAANDIPPLGAAIRLAYPREVSRNFFESQGEPRRAEEVGAGANLNAGQGIARLYERRVSEVARDLSRDWPLRRFA